MWINVPERCPDRLIVKPLGDPAWHGNDREEMGQWKHLEFDVLCFFFFIQKNLSLGSVPGHLANFLVSSIVLCDKRPSRGATWPAEGSSPGSLGFLLMPTLLKLCDFLKCHCNEIHNIDEPEVLTVRNLNLISTRDFASYCDVETGFCSLPLSSSRQLPYLSLVKNVCPKLIWAGLKEWRQSLAYSGYTLIAKPNLIMHGFSVLYKDRFLNVCNIRI